MSVVLINAREFPEYRAVVLSGEQVISYYHTVVTESDWGVGNIYRGRVVKVERGLDAAFVDIGSEKHAFLPLSNIPSEKGSSSKKRKVRANQTLMVQVVREQSENKGALLTGYISVAGRFLVLSPFESGVHISRKMRDSAERERLRRIVKDMAPPSFSFIVRTAATGVRKTDIAKDMRYLLRLYRKITQEAKARPAPCLLYSDADVAMKVSREFLPSDVEQIIVDDEEQFERLKNILEATVPRFVRRLKLYDSARPLFDSYGVEEQLQRLQEKEVPLPSGGRIVIEQTEALVSVDINSGAMKGADIEETAFETNLEAVEEVARQLRLRDLGGLVVIDTIDMVDREHRVAVEKRLRKAMRSDRAKHTILPTNRLGLITLSRQRQSSLLETTILVTSAAGQGA